MNQTDQNGDEATWRSVRAHLCEVFEILDEGREHLTCEVGLAFEDGRETTREVRVSTTAGDRLLVEAALGRAGGRSADSLLRQGAELDIGAVVSRDGAYVLRHRLGFAGLTPDLLDDVILSLSEAAASMTDDDAAASHDLFHHFC
jgi:hypothetical protein